MTVIRHWRLVYGDGSVSLWMSGSDAPEVPDDAVERVEFEDFVPADDYRGAVEALREARALGERWVKHPDHNGHGAALLAVLDAYGGQ